MGIPKKCYNLAVSGHQSEKYSSWRLSEKQINEPFLEIRENVRETSRSNNMFPKTLAVQCPTVLK
jgi:hypothetical protein